MADYDKLITSLTGTLKRYGDIKAEETKLKTALLANQIEANQNFFTKIQEKNYQSPYQQTLARQFQNQQGGQPIDQNTNVLSQPIQPEVRMGNEGFQVNYPNAKEFAYNMITKKEQRGFKLSPKEQKFKDSYMGVTNYGSATLEKVRNDRTEKLILGIENNNLQRDMIKRAQESAKKIQGGIYGKIQRGMLRRFSPNSPVLQDWQNIKMVLTDAQLMNVAKTKGAISDREMELFSKAAANDDITSLPMMIPVFNKVMKLINSGEIGMVNAYKKIYGENPYDWSEVQSNIDSQSIKSNNDYGLDSKVKQAREAGYSEEEISNFLKKNGLTNGR